MAKLPLILATLTGLASSALAQAPVFDGNWAANPESCNASNSDLVPLWISGDVIQHYESRCALINTLLIPGLPGKIFDMECTGEGESWTTRGLLLLNEDDSIVYSHDGWSVIMHRCH